MTMTLPNRASINFVEGSREPVFSNWDPSRVRMDLVPVESELVNMRAMQPAPALDKEGFALVSHDVAGDWRDPSWVDGVYVPSCVELARKMAGAREAAQIFFPLIRSTSPVEGVAYTGSFLHLDIPRDEYLGLARIEAEQKGLTLEPGKAAIYNVWKPVTPPPQSAPLALCRRHDLTESDHVVGLNDEDAHRSHFVAVKAPDRPLKLHYVPDMAIAESLIFVAADFDPAHSLGCAHQAITMPESASLIPRTSIEVRVLCLF